MNKADESDEEIWTYRKFGSKKNRKQRLLSSGSSSCESTNNVEITEKTENVPSREVEEISELKIEERRKRIRIFSEDSSSSSSSSGEFDIIDDKEVVENRCLQEESMMTGLSYSVLEIILTKALLLRGDGGKLVRKEIKESVPHRVAELKRVDSTWNDVLSSKRLKTKFHNNLDLLVPPVSLQFVANLEIDNPVAVTKLGKKFYILRADPVSLSVYKDGSPPVLKKELALEQIKEPTDIAGDQKGRFLYVGDRRRLCIWRLQLEPDGDGFEMEEWMRDVENLWTFSITNVGYVVLPRNAPFDSIDLYEADGNLIRKIVLPEVASHPGHAAFKLSGNFILSHSVTCALSEINPKGRLMHNFKPSADVKQRFFGFLFTHFALDKKERVIVLDGFKNRVVLLDENLGKVILLETGSSGIVQPSRLYYDRRKDQLIVVGSKTVALFKIIENE